LLRFDRSYTGHVAEIAPKSSRMIFAGNEEPAAFLHLKSIGLPQTSLKRLSAALGQLLSEHCCISSNRVYIEFTDAKGAFWGFDGNTFG
jgi:phenylpyruvate tautomerase